MCKITTNIRKKKKKKHLLTITGISGNSVIIQIGVALGRICNPAALNISICNAIIGLKILIFRASGLQLAFPLAADRWFPMSITLLYLNSKDDCVDTVGVMISTYYI